MRVKKGWSSKVSGSLLEREILKQLEFWYPKAKPVWGDHRWLVWSIPEWIGKLPGSPSDKSIRRALTHLKEQGLIITERHRHPYRQGAGPVLWVRPDYDAIDRKLTETGPNTDRILTETYIQKTVEHNDRGQDHSGDPSGAPHEIDFTGKEAQVKGADFLAKKKAQATVAAGKSVFDKTYSVDNWPKVNTPEKAHNCLRDASLAAGYAAPGSFNKMRGGQMKTMLTRMVGEGVGYDEIAKVLFFVCARWPEFISWAKDKFNVNVQGTAPNHSSLTMYAVEAVGFQQSYAATAEPVKETNGGGSSLDEDF